MTTTRWLQLTSENASRDMAVNKMSPKPRRTLTHIPNPLTVEVSQNSSSSIVFLDPSQPGSIDDSTSYYGNHQIAHLSKPWGVVEKAQYSNTSKARQDARVHIFTAALLEHICSLYEPRPERRQRVLQELCTKLTERDMLSPIAFLDIFSLWRNKYQIGFSELMKSTVTLIDKEATVGQSSIPKILSESHQMEVALLTKPSINMLMRSPSDPRSAFFSSRYYHDFHEIKSIGSGGFGSVFKVRNKLDEVLYAIKKIRLKQLNHEKCRKLLREVKVLATLNHPAIVRYNSAWLEQQPESKITEVGDENMDSESEGSSSNDAEYEAHSANPFPEERVVLYIHMELCHSNLHDWLAKRNKKLFNLHKEHDIVCGHIHESENMLLTRQLLNGLDYIHTLGIIHRDIKTRNIFIGSHGALKIGDFGLARDIVASPSPSNEYNSSFDFSGRQDDSDKLSRGIGTSVYSSPEQQSERLYDSKTDIYSAGIIVFELYCPFSTEMERYNCIKDLRKNKTIPRTLLVRWSDQMSMVTKMVDISPIDRPSAKTLLSSNLYLDKDQIISHLEIRIEELEMSNIKLKQEMKLLNETLNIEGTDYAEFQKWRESRNKPDK